ncbi:hypothetical protein Nepgr_022986 [Nepenthes gracilis]|uniref:Uncharacterized protein n=1 Tax=Nepenthes gracilis TaxID=150966 RepID=A0AAD3T1S7_NEPGR|nr:hypothetical protein Nepgr_022986 [Nepenthes gracilis]
MPSLDLDVGAGLRVSPLSDDSRDACSRNLPRIIECAVLSLCSLRIAPCAKAEVFLRWNVMPLWSMPMLESYRSWGGWWICYSGGSVVEFPCWLKSMLVYEVGVMQLHFASCWWNTRGASRMLLRVLQGAILDVGAIYRTSCADLKVFVAAAAFRWRWARCDATTSLSASETLPPGQVGKWSLFLAMGSCKEKFLCAFGCP